MKLVLGMLDSGPFPEDAVLELKKLITVLAKQSLQIRCHVADLTERPIYYRYMELLLRVSGDPEGGLAWKSLAKVASTVPSGKVVAPGRAV